MGKEMTPEEQERLDRITARYPTAQPLTPDQKSLIKKSVKGDATDEEKTQLKDSLSPEQHAEARREVYKAGFKPSLTDIPGLLLMVLGIVILAIVYSMWQG